MRMLYHILIIIVLLTMILLLHDIIEMIGLMKLLFTR